ncbi:hypothetical protein GCM10023328_13760 [Modestobacter marinus]|uniref:Uncharacterized protein n=1 Tax=Modestobacter marinus TaxID=477641 RepID=A0A846LZY3_9ACTN|nr:hypothetical protein [Modestobacter marinus]NIH68989.1 hypothetical protein [Modestobacter marinus]GGL78436.1 hypothetical protein GCM10011589_38100 [Modestobacter marinus]
MTGSHGPLHLIGELSLEVDGSGVQVHADGADVRVVAEDVGAFVARVREAATARTGVAPGRRDVGGLADTLAAAGITAHLESPSRPVAVAGAGVDSPAGALLLGTRRVQPRAAVVLVAADRGRWVIGAGAATAVLLTVLARRRR